jgi:hypothetical protein
VPYTERSLETLHRQGTVNTCDKETVVTQAMKHINTLWRRKEHRAGLSYYWLGRNYADNAFMIHAVA